MPHISRAKLDSKFKKELLESLESVFERLSKEETKLFLNSILSPTERLMIAKRLGIVVLLKENVPQSKIALTLSVTRETVNRMQLFLEIKGEGYNTAFKKLQKEQFMKDFKSLLLKLANYSVRAAGGYVKPEIF